MTEIVIKPRRRARELALKGLYAWEMSNNSKRDILDFMSKEECGNDAEVYKFASDLVTKTMELKESLDEEIASATKNWDLHRIATVDRYILRLALCEFLTFEDIPPKVTINEAIDLAKTYSTAESGRFVNGILDALYQRLRSENRIAKKGRGLIES